MRRLGVGRKDGPDFLVEARDVPAAGAQLVQQPMPLQDGDAHAGLVGGQGHGLADELEALLQQFGPAVQESHGQFGVEVVHQFEGCG